MKSRLAILALLGVCLWGRAASADTVVNVSATQCDGCFSGTTPPPIDLDAQFKVKEVFGTFEDPGIATFVTTDVYEVKGIKGTLNGDPISLLQFPFGVQASQPSWFYLNLSPGALYFSAGGTEYRIIFDNLFVLLQTQSGQDPLDFRASVRKPGDPKQSSIDPVDPTPEPTSFVLLAIGLMGLGWLRPKGCIFTLR